MGQSYYAQPMVGEPTPTITVRQLIDRLEALPDDMPVVFQTPQYGAFGSNHLYAIGDAAVIDIAAFEQTYPASTYIDDETGNEIAVEAWTDRRPAWRGVVVA